MSRSDRLLVAAVGAAIVLTIAAAWLLLPSGVPAAEEDANLDAALLLATPAASASAAVAETGTLVVDVQGAVVAPGVRQLPAGSRVADALEAAGGYASDVDLIAASTAINLAQALTDGQQLRVPRLGEAVMPASAGGAPGANPGAEGAGGLVNLNTATPEELEALPGIGPVTVQKLVAGRQERPFASLEDAVERGILNRGQLEQIQGLATAG